jgi:hypothetical protein
MQDLSKILCRNMLNRIMPDVKKLLTKDSLKHVWVYQYKKSQSWEFHITACEQFPNGLFYEVQAANNSEAKFRGFSRLITELQEAYKKHGQCFFCNRPATYGWLKHAIVCPECAEKVQYHEPGYEL